MLVPEQCELSILLYKCRLLIILYRFSLVLFTLGCGLCPLHIKALQVIGLTFSVSQIHTHYRVRRSLCTSPDYSCNMHTGSANIFIPAYLLDFVTIWIYYHTKAWLFTGCFCNIEWGVPF